jgi:hypothetical protein
VVRDKEQWQLLWLFFSSFLPFLDFLPFSFIPLVLVFSVLSSLFFFILSFLSLFFFLSVFFLPLKLPKSGVSIPPSSLFFTFLVISSFSGHVLLSIMSLSILFFFSPLSPLFLPSISLVPLKISPFFFLPFSPAVYNGERGRDNYYPCPIMAQG